MGLTSYHCSTAQYFINVLPPGLEPGTLALGPLMRFELILTNKILINSLDFYYSVYHQRLSAMLLTI